MLLAATEAVPLVAAATSSTEVLLGEFSSVVFTRAEGGDFGEVGFLFCGRFGFCERNPQEGDQDERYLFHNTTYTVWRGVRLQGCTFVAWSGWWRRGIK